MCLAFGLISVLLDQTSCVLFPFLVMYMVSMYTVQWHLSVKIARNGSPSSWTGQIDSFIQTLQVDLVLERTRCKCFCSASTVVPSTMRRTITEYGEETHCYGWGIDWTTRHDINSDTCFFRFFVLVSVRTSIVSFFQFIFPAFCLYCLGMSGSLALDKYRTWYCGAVEPLFSSYPFLLSLSLQCPALS